jgi:hypothetical protein
MTIEEVIAGLQKLDLSTYPTEEAVALLKAIQGVAIVEMTLHAGKTIIRGRENLIETDNFNTRDLLSYKPQEFNNTYQRASTPQETMFYGSIIPELVTNGEEFNERIIASFEVLKWFRHPLTNGIRDLTFSKWEVVDDIHLVSLIHNQRFYHTSSYTKKVVDDYMKFLERYPQEVRDRSIAATTYLAEEYGKENTDPDYHYLISALHSHIVCQLGFDGVHYPSVRMKGQGFNVAINPKAVDERLRLVGAGKCRLYKLGEKRTIDNETIAEVTDDKLPFNYTEVQAEYHSGELECLKTLGLSSLEDLL